MATQRRLNQEVLVSTALELADTEGLEAVTIRRLAQHHDVTPMALYRHFRDKEQILDALAERLLSDVALPEPDGRPWHEQMDALLGAFVAALRPHPNTAGLVLPRVLASEPGLALAERALGLLAEAGFPVEQAAETGTQALCSLVTLVMSEPAGVRSPDPEVREEAVRAKKAVLAALSPRRYPHISAAAGALAACAGKQEYYTNGVRLIVAGMRGVRPGPGPAAG
jgi:TetR/AcrR family transcriptional regulator, tetracycline repressor protein